MIEKIRRYLKKKMRRHNNQKHIADYPECSGGWEKYENNPILGDNKTGTMFDPFVRWMNERYTMCVSRRRDNTLMLYTSDNGIDWTDGKVILKGIADSSWETEVNRGCFVILNKKWYLWYTGQHRQQSRIGLAISEDGVHFHRKSDIPVLEPEYEFEGSAVMNPCVLWDEERQKFRMWYAAGENYEPDVICYAESHDGIRWEKHPKPILTKDEGVKYQQYKVGACDIIKRKDGSYLMAYIAYQNLDVARIAMAVSSDGTNDWRDLSDLPILSPGKGKWDCNSVYKPTLCITDDSVLLWYNGRGKHSESIGFAYKKRLDIL